MEESKTKPEDGQPKNSPETDGSLSPEKLNKVAGGRTIVRAGGDPCEGGEFTQR